MKITLNLDKIWAEDEETISALVREALTREIHVEVRRIVRETMKDYEQQIKGVAKQKAVQLVAQAKRQLAELEREK